MVFQEAISYKISKQDLGVHHVDDLTQRKARSVAGTRRGSELCNQLYTKVFRRITGNRGLLYQILWSRAAWCSNGASEEMLRQERSRDIVCPEL